MLNLLYIILAMCVLLWFTKSGKRDRSNASPELPPKKREVYLTRLADGRPGYVARMKTKEDRDADPEEGLRIGSKEYRKRMRNAWLGIPATVRVPAEVLAPKKAAAPLQHPEPFTVDHLMKPHDMPPDPYGPRAPSLAPDPPPVETPAPAETVGAPVAVVADGKAHVPREPAPGGEESKSGETGEAGEAGTAAAPVPAPAEETK